MYPPSIQKLIEIFSKFPTIGPRTATRFVFHLLNQPEKETGELIEAISVLHSRIRTCVNCFNQFEPSADAAKEKEFCPICSNKSRDKATLCIVASETDLQAIEKTKKYKGLYFVLGGTFSSLKKSELLKLRLRELEERIKDNRELKEIILALNPTTEGEATALYLERLLSQLRKKITRLGRGIPIGGELEYVDDETLSSALEGRK